MSLETMRDVFGVTPTPQLALKATSDDARDVLEDKVETVVERDYPNLAVLSNDELKSDVEEQVNQQFGVLQRDRRASRSSSACSGSSTRSRCR